MRLFEYLLTKYTVRVRHIINRYFRDIRRLDNCMIAKVKGVREMGLVSLKEYWESNSDIIEGWIFSTIGLTISTPLEGLIHYGEKITGYSSPRPEYPYGEWMPYTKMALELDMPDITASDVGPVSGKEYAAFLIIFRSIVDDNNLEYREKVARVRSIPKTHPSYQKFYSKLKKNHPGFPESAVGGRITEIPGVGKKTESILFSHGIRSREDLRITSDAELSKIPGIGAAMIAKIRGGI